MYTPVFEAAETSDCSGKPALLRYCGREQGYAEGDYLCPRLWYVVWQPRVLSCVVMCFLLLYTVLSHIKMMSRGFHSFLI